MSQLSRAALITLAAAVSSLAAQRVIDPVVVEGSALPPLLGRPTDRIVAFKWEFGWQQIPVQVDERAVLNLRQVYGRPRSPWDYDALVYTDADTFTGADPDPSFDADDELVVLASDAGGPAGFDHPAGTLPDTQVGLTVVDLLGGPDRYVYLYVHDGSLDPAAGRNDVEYTFVLLSGDYRQTYNRDRGPNPENSVAQTSAYRVHFSDRWIDDELSVTAPGATGVDVLDFHGIQVRPGDCRATSVTFSTGGGAIVANLDGPIRGVRSIIGARSGGITQRVCTFYPTRIDFTLHVRVHPLEGQWEFVDYSPAAAGMVYYDNHNQGGATVDGTPDSITSAVLEWQLVTGSQGSLTHVFTRDTDIVSLNESSHYFDELNPSFTQCTGDAFAYAKSGTQLDGLPNTDPTQGAANRLVMLRAVYVEPPGVTAQQAATRSQQVRNPLQTRIIPPFRPIGASCPGTVGTPVLDAAGVSEVGGQVTLRVTPLRPGQPGALVVGFFELQPPVDLTILGMAGCFQYVPPTILLSAASGAGTVFVGLGIPDDSSLIGGAVLQQYAGLDPGANVLGIIATNAVEFTVGG